MGADEDRDGRTEYITLIEAIGGNDCGIVSKRAPYRLISLAGISNAEVGAGD